MNSEKHLSKKEEIEEHFLISDHIYEDFINVVFTNDINRSIKYQCKENGIKPKHYLAGEEADAIVCHVHKKGYHAEWCLFDVDKITDPIIVHECVHIAHNMLHPRGIHHESSSTDEAYAYLTAWLFGKIKGFHEEYKKGISPPSAPFTT